MELPPENPIRQSPPTQPNAWPSDLDAQIAPTLFSDKVEAPLPIPEPAVPLLDGSADRDERARSNFLRILPVLLAFGVLGLATSLWAIPRIEDTLRESTIEALAANGITSGAITFDGRDAKLSGFPDDISAEAFAAVSDVSGVRSVEFVDAATPKELVDLTITIAEDVLTIDGTVLNNEQALALRDAAGTGSFEKYRFDDQIVIDDVDSPEEDDVRVRQVAELLGSLSLAESAEVTVRGSDIRVQAVVPGFDAKQVIETAALPLLLTPRELVIEVDPTARADFSDTPDIEDDDETDEPGGFLIPAGPQLDVITEEFNSASSFEPGSATLTPDGEAALDKLAQLLIDFEGLSLQITGHTDNTGDAIDNVRLSQRRADAVVDYLVEAGVENDRLIAIGLGSAKPLESNDTDEGRAQNRRVEFEMAS